jgi:hypothetical protein
MLCSKVGGMNFQSFFVGIEIFIFRANSTEAVMANSYPPKDWIIESIDLWVLTLISPFNGLMLKFVPYLKL